MFQRCLHTVASPLRVASRSLVCPSVVPPSSDDSLFDRRLSHTSAQKSLPVKIGVIGCGRIGQFHAQTVAASSIGRVIWIADSNELSAKPLCRQLNARFLPSAKVESVVMASPLDPLHVDAVIVCAPTQFSYQYTSHCLDAQKPVFGEKPLATDLHRLKGIIQKAKDQQTLLTIGYQRVYDRDIRKLIQKVRGHAQETKTAPLSISMRSYDSPIASDNYLRTCGSVFLDAMCHDFHVASSLLSIDALLQSAVAMEIPFSDATLGARSAAVMFRTEDNTAITSEFHRVSQIVISPLLSIKPLDRMFRLSSRPRWMITEGNGKGCLISADYDEGFLTKYADAYNTEMLEFLGEVSAGAMINHHRLDICIRTMQMIQLAIDASESGREAFLARL